MSSSLNSRAWWRDARAMHTVPGKCRIEKAVMHRITIACEPVLVRNLRVIFAGGGVAYSELDLVAR